MLQLTVLYGQPQDPTAFDRYYRETHSQTTRKIPGLKGYITHKPVLLNSQEQSPYYLIADLYFEDLAALQAALQSPEGQAAAGDLQNFATGGAQLLAGEIQVYDPVTLGS